MNLEGLKIVRPFVEGPAYCRVAPVDPRLGTGYTDIRHSRAFTDDLGLFRAARMGVLPISCYWIRHQED